MSKETTIDMSFFKTPTLKTGGKKLYLQKQPKNLLLNHLQYLPHFDIIL